MKWLPRAVFILALLAFIFNIVYVWQSPAMKNSIMGNDEYFFYRTTTNLPNYNTDGMWLYDDGAPNPPEIENAYVWYLFNTAYTSPVWIHPPLANFVAYPIAVLFDDVAWQIQWLRLFDVAVIIITVALFADIIRRRTTPYIGALSVFPMMFGRLLLANGIMFYNDLFMWLFFALTMWAIEYRPRSKWIILLAVITVLTKMNALLLLVPIVIYHWYKTRRISLKLIVLPVCSVLAFVVFQAVVTRDIFYLYNHWGTLNPNAKLNIARNVMPYLWSYVVSWGLWVSIPLLVAGIFLTFWRRIKAYYAFATFGIVTLLFGFGWGSYAYQVYPIMYSSMFMVPVVFWGGKKQYGGCDGE